MAVKAREEVRMDQISPFLLIGIGAIVIAYILIYDTYVYTLTDVTLRTGISIGATIIMLITFFIILRFVSTAFNLTLTHIRLTIERKILFWHRQEANITAKSFVDFVEESAYTGKETGKNFTVGKMEDMHKYILTYNEGGTVKHLKMQCSDKFAGEMKKLVEANTKPQKTKKKK
jgi:hypothetical protein